MFFSKTFRLETMAVTLEWQLSRWNGKIRYSTTVGSAAMRQWTNKVKCRQAKKKKNKKSRGVFLDSTAYRPAIKIVGKQDCRLF